MIMKGYVQWNLFTIENISPQAGLMTASSVGQRLTNWATVAPGHKINWTQKQI